MENDIIKKFINTDYKLLEKELEELSKKDKLRLEVDQGLDEALRDLEIISAKMPQEQTQKLFDQCANNAMDAVVGHFGFAAVILDAKDGGNVTTLHNFKKGIVSNKEDLQILNDFEQGYDREASSYDDKKDEIREKSPKIVQSEYTGQEMERGSGKGKAHIDHVISTKEFDRDPSSYLFLDEEIRKELVNNPDNLKWLEASANSSKQDKNLMEWGREIDPKTGQSNFEKYGIEEKQAKKIYNKAKKSIEKVKTKKKFIKYSKKVLETSHKDAVKIAAYSALGVVLKDFIKAVIIELKVTFKEFGNESLKEILVRFKDRFCKVWEELKLKWKDILKNSLEGALQDFFSNLVVFIINIFATTLKKIVQIIRAGFTSLWQAVKIITNPPKDMPKEDIYYEASKIMVTGLISAITMLGAGSIEELLKTVPGINALLLFSIPFTNQTVGEALSLCIGAACGAILSTIAIFYMDKWRNDSKIGSLQIQLVAQNGVVMHYKIAQTWFVLGDAYKIMENKTIDTVRKLNNATKTICRSSQDVEEIIDEFSEYNDMKEMLEQFNKKRKNNV